MRSLPWIVLAAVGGLLGLLSLALHVPVSDYEWVVVLGTAFAMWRTSKMVRPERLVPSQLMLAGMAGLVAVPAPIYWPSAPLLVLLAITFVPPLVVMYSRDWVA